ncbi:MAG: UDP-N-acetylmuramate--L-alanine ligase [Flavobacteriales bacterium]
MEFDKLKSVFFLGVGGIGMSALARYFLAQHKLVFGYDKTKSKLCQELQKEGITITYEDAIDFIKTHKLDPEHCLCVYTPALPKELNLIQALKANGFSLLKRAEVLGLISKTKTCLAVAGTHGKTSTSAILAHIMACSKHGSSAFIGGILSNYKSNLILQDGPFMVAEADEFDRSFLQLDVQDSILTSMDPDHLDIYGTEEEFKSTFETYLNKVKRHKIVHHSLPIEGTHSYGLSADADWFAEDIHWNGKGMSFVFCDQKNEVKETFEMPFPGLHNVENAVAAIGLANLQNVDYESIKLALKQFRGIYRRFEIHQLNNRILIDDYAHHPKELKESLASARACFPNKTIAVLFQPHLFSRTKDFMSEFADVLSKADVPAVIDIYPAREKPIKGITSQALAKLNSKLTYLKPEDIHPFLDQHPFDVLMVLGAGDIANLVEPLKAFLSKS